MAAFKVNGLHFGFAQMTKMDKPGLVSLFPNFVLFVVFVISGSKAVSTYPVLVFVCATNVLPAVTFLIDSSSSLTGQHSLIQKGLAVTALPSAGLVVWSATNSQTQSGASGDDDNDDHLRHQALIYDGLFWLAVHLMCGVALSFHSRYYIIRIYFWMYMTQAFFWTHVWKL